MLETSHRHRRKEARPQELLEAALALFVERGFAATRLEEIATRAGVSKGTLYLYFSSKEDLFKAVVRHTLAAEIAAGQRDVEAFSGSAGEAMVEVLSDWWSRIHASPASGVFKLAITEMQNFPDLAQFYAEEVVNPGFALVASMLERGIAEGEFRPIDVPSAVRSILLPLIMMCLHKHSLGACGLADPALINPDTFIRRHLLLLMNGMLAPHKILA
jgi:AcrR family transcriptional regulator